MPNYPAIFSWKHAAAQSRDNNNNTFMACSWQVQYYFSSFLADESFFTCSVFTFPVNAVKVLVKNAIVRRQYNCNVNKPGGGAPAFAGEYDIITGLVPALNEYLYLGFSDHPLATSHPATAGIPTHSPSIGEFIAEQNLVVPLVQNGPVGQIQNVAYESTITNNKLQTYLNIYHRAENLLAVHGADYTNTVSFMTAQLFDVTYAMDWTRFFYHAHINLEILEPF